MTLRICYDSKPICGMKLALYCKEKMLLLLQATGGKYEGEYVGDVKNGTGTYTYANGDVYDGQWKDGLKHGKGTYKYKDDGGM